MTKYAKGGNAIAECQRSGQKMLYRDLVEDGHIPGLLVHPDWWEPKHPQEIPVIAEDPVALYRPAPEISEPVNEGDPLDGVIIPSAPDDTYQPSTQTAGPIGNGVYTIPVVPPVTYLPGTPVWVKLDDIPTWCKGVTADGSDSPTYVIHLLEPWACGPLAPGAPVYVGPTGSGTPVAPPVTLVAISNQTISDVYDITESIALYTLDAFGFATYNRSQDLTTTFIPDEWLVSGVASDYEVRTTLLSGTAPTFNSGGPLDVWWPMDVLTTFSLTEFGVGNTKTGTVLVEIRLVSSGVVLDSANITLSVHRI